MAMDASGKVVANLEGERSVGGFRGMMKAGQEYRDFKAKAEKGDPVAKIEYFIRALKLGEFKLDAARKHIETLKGVTPEQKARIDGLIVGLEVDEALEPLRKVKERGKAMEIRVDLGRKFWEMHKSGRIPGDDSPFGTFYSFVLDFAENDKNIPVFEVALKALQDRFPNGNKGFFKAKADILEKMKEEKAEKEPK
ncbi:MAG TPA: hypothetical protein VGK61_06765 [Planctomycetota bacterium]